MLGEIEIENTLLDVGWWDQCLWVLIVVASALLVIGAAPRSSAGCCAPGARRATATSPRRGSLLTVSLREGTLQAPRQTAGRWLSPGD
jgi:hypothetical protein